MSDLKDFHHYKGNDVTRFEKVEKKVIDLLLTSKIPDSKRENDKTNSSLPENFIILSQSKIVYNDICIIMNNKILKQKAPRNRTITLNSEEISN